MSRRRAAQRLCGRELYLGKVSVTSALERSRGCRNGEGLFSGRAGGGAAACVDRLRCQPRHWAGRHALSGGGRHARTTKWPASRCIPFEPSGGAHEGRARVRRAGRSTGRAHHRTRGRTTLSQTTENSAFLQKNISSPGLPAWATTSSLSSLFACARPWAGRRSPSGPAGSRAARGVAVARRRRVGVSSDVRGLGVGPTRTHGSTDDGGDWEDGVEGGTARGRCASVRTQVQWPWGRGELRGVPFRSSGERARAYRRRYRAEDGARPSVDSAFQRPPRPTLPPRPRL